MGFRKRTKEEALNEITELVKAFEVNKKQYLDDSYNEANVRSNFIDKFFEALNWDVRNDDHLAERFRDVIVEDRLEIDGQIKAPDYSFCIKGQRVFYVEAKKPSIDIKNEVAPAFQVRRYAYTKGLKLSILTDFEEFAVYETSTKPKKNDKASKSRIKFITYKDYIKEFDYFWDVFSYDAVAHGEFDNYINSDKKLKGTSTIDKDFLDTIENWRKELAKNIALRNANLSLSDLNFAVQKIIDRIIFLRIVEEKGIEQPDYLKYISTLKIGIYKGLIKYFKDSNERYNSGLFKEYDWLNKIVVDDTVLNKIINELYFPECPYAWNELPIEILGNIYEKFLGSTITFRNVANGNHTAIVEEKPEIKKAGGVFYTPKYIVDYIVKETIGKKLEKCSLADVDKITICDPACGSGSFLVGAYKYLLDWYLNQYTIDIKKIKAYLKPDINGYIRLEKKYTKNDITEYKLTIKEKQRILLKHIYGVDIDFNATEVTKLSLFLVLLNDEGIDGGNNDLSFIKLLDYKLLPNMTNNIKCGNSLIGTDYYLGNFIKQFTVDEQTKINAFDWGKEFEEIFRNGGFDIVIGNPPYGISIENEQRLYIEQQLGKIPDFEIYYCFMQKAFIIAKNGAVVSFIVPNTWLFNVFASNFRTEVLTKWNIVEILDCTNIEIFETAKVRNSIFVFKKTKANNEKIAYKQTKTMNSFYKLISQETQYTSKDKLLFMNANWGLVFQLSERYISIIQNIIKKSKQLIEYFPEVSQGLIPYDKYKGQSIQTIKNRVFHYNKYKKGLKKNLWGEDVTRYNIIWNGKEWIDYCEGIANPREPKYFIGNRLLIREITNPRIFAACTDEEMYNDPAILIVKDSNKYSIKVLEAIFNSKLATFYHFNHSPKATKGSFPKILIKDVKEFPLPKVDEKLKNIIETLVDQMVESMKNITKSFTEQEKKNTKDIVNAIDRKIDEKVYELYKLSKEDIKIIENTIK